MAAVAVRNLRKKQQQQQQSAVVGAHEGQQPAKLSENAQAYVTNKERGSLDSQNLSQASLRNDLVIKSRIFKSHTEFHSKTSISKNCDLLNIKLIEQECCH